MSYKDLYDVYTLPVGFRTARVEGSRFLINNIPFYFKGFGKIQDSDVSLLRLFIVFVLSDVYSKTRLCSKRRFALISRTRA